MHVFLAQEFHDISPPVDYFSPPAVDDLLRSRRLLLVTGLIDLADQTLAQPSRRRADPTATRARSPGTNRNRD